MDLNSFSNLLVLLQFLIVIRWQGDPISASVAGVVSIRLHP